MATTKTADRTYPLQANVRNRDSVAARSQAWLAMEADWRLTDALLGGTRAMREAGDTYLPQEPKETNGSYKVRLERSFLLGAYKDTLNAICGKPFSRPIVLRGGGESGLGEQIAPIEGNANREGDDLTQFAKAVFKNGIHRGMSLILVDYPTAGMGPDGKVASLRQQREQDIRPYFVMIDIADVWGMKYERDAAGTRKLVRIQIHESAVVPDGEWSERVVERVRVLYAPGEPPMGSEQTSGDGHWELYENQEKDEWVLVDSGTHTFPGIPIVPFYTNQTGFMQAMPALMDLADKNLEHYQSSSDQRNILRFVRFAMLYATGISEEEKDEEIIVGPKSILRSTSTDAKFGFVEHTGAGVKAGRDDLQDLQAQMEILGLQPLVQKSGNTTATGKAMDEGKKFSAAQLWVRALEGALVEAFRYAGVWLKGPGYELPDDFAIDIHSEFGLGARAAADNEFLLKARQAKEIDRETFLEEIRRRGLLHEFTVVQEIMDRLEEEQQENLAMMSEVMPGEEGGDEGDQPPSLKSGEEE
jgi:hypothetical protein